MKFLSASILGLWAPTGWKDGINSTIPQYNKP